MLVPLLVAGYLVFTLLVGSVLLLLMYRAVPPDWRTVAVIYAMSLLWPLWLVVVIGDEIYRGLGRLLDKFRSEP